jgi:hypothetical protein
MRETGSGYTIFVGKKKVADHMEELGVIEGTLLK